LQRKYHSEQDQNRELIRMVVSPPGRPNPRRKSKALASWRSSFGKDAIAELVKTWYQSS
jgi:hypothetical protein